jgi:hypothetical protein
MCIRDSLQIGKQRVEFSRRDSVDLAHQHQATGGEDRQGADGIEEDRPAHLPAAKELVIEIPGLGRNQLPQAGLGLLEEKRLLSVEQQQRRQSLVMEGFVEFGWFHERTGADRQKLSAS